MAAMRALDTPLVGVSWAEEDRLVCHCRQVPYSVVADAIDSGQAQSLADVQHTTKAVTRCFGCRFEVERMLAERLGDRYVRGAVVFRPPDDEDAEAARDTKRMYMPVLHGLAGDVRTKVTLFNWSDQGDDAPPVSVRADVLDMHGERLDVMSGTVAHRQSLVLDISGRLPEGALPEGAGVLKIVLDAEEVGSLRPYFQFVTPGGITSTHEKSAPRRELGRRRLRRYHWTFPVGLSTRPRDAYFFFTNTLLQPLTDHALVWRSETGEEARVALPTVELDQSLCVPLHEAFPEVASGEQAGTVRMDPATHIAGFILRHDREADLWLVQHL
jgi:bacterioferritin-associated ferredoxin